VSTWGALEFKPAAASAAARHKPTRTRAREYRGAPATLIEPYASPPRICRQTATNGAPAPEGTRPSGCAVGGVAGRPRAPSRAPQTTGRGAQRTRLRRGRPRFCPPRAKLRGGPPAPPSFGKRTPRASRLQAEWGHGVGRHARQMRGEIVSTCKKLRVRSRSRGVQSKMYRLMYPESAAFLNLQRETHVCRIYI
jgi:hypothetical protein